MHITYDPEVDALYIRFKTGTVTTKKVAPGIAIDTDSSGKIAGIEVLSFKRFGSLSSLRKVTLEDIGLSSRKS
ncbi:MAG: DUF2283 domain-containing protein [Candidatus Omnitrophica bacterium]|nr:DUF2283 domain-containing protein [Candidatus Omnitrophota bacterium]